MPVQRSVELGAVVVVKKVAQLVEQHLVNAFAWCLYQQRVQRDAARRRTASPLHGHEMQARRWRLPDPAQGDTAEIRSANSSRARCRYQASRVDLMVVGACFGAVTAMKAPRMRASTVASVLKIAVVAANEEARNGGLRWGLAETVRFELTEGINPRRFSRPLP